MYVAFIPPRSRFKLRSKGIAGCLMKAVSCLLGKVAESSFIADPLVVVQPAAKTNPLQVKIRSIDMIPWHPNFAVPTFRNPFFNRVLATVKLPRVCQFGHPCSLSLQSSVEEI